MKTHSVHWLTALFMGVVATPASALDCSAWSTQRDMTACATRLTRERTDAIERLLRCPEGDLACQVRRP